MISNERVKYIDFIKGIAIILVVMGHVELYILSRHDIFITIISAIHVPTFIFLSGYLSYKNKAAIQTQDIFLALWNKFKRLLIPFFLISILYAITFRLNYFLLFENSYKYGYWFTFTLFSLYAIYIISSVLSNKQSTIWKDIILYICIYLILSSLFYSHFISDKVLGILSLQQIVFYFPTFIFGVLMKKYSFYFEYLTQHIVILIVSLLTFISCIIMCEIFKIDNLPILIISNISGVYLLIHTFKKLESSHFVNHLFINFLGSKSLEIYLIHFFFLIPLKEIWNQYLLHENSQLFLILYIIVFSAIVLSITILVINIITKSSILNKILFGNK
jgi:fucose 4-O-acetylase-like acetyltransferase